MLERSMIAGVLVLAILAVRVLFKRAPKNFRLILWALVAVRLVCPFTISSVFSLIPSQETIQIVRESGEALFVPGNGAESENRDISVIQTQEPIRTDESVQTRFDWEKAAKHLWICGMTVLTVYSFVSFWRLKRRVSVSVQLEENVWQCDEIDTPFVAGVFRPQIYLPSGLSEEETAYVLLHEKAHMKRRDPLWKAVGFLLLIVYWFQPLLWIGYGFFAKDIELACDETVIRSMELSDRKEYSRVLLNMSSSGQKMPVCPLAFGEIGVKERIKQILNYKKPGFWAMIAAAAAVVILAAGFLTRQEDLGIIGGADGPTAIIVGETQKESYGGHPTLETVKDQLSKLPADSAGLRQNDCFILDYQSAEWNRASNVGVWNRFCDKVERGISAEIVFAHWTTEGCAVFDFISYDGTDFYHVYDFRRDRFAEPGDGIEEETYENLYVFQSETEEGERYQTVILSDVPDLTYETFLEAEPEMFEGEKPLYRNIAIISLGESNEEFYVDTLYTEDITDETMNDRFREEYGWTNLDYHQVSWKESDGLVMIHYVFLSGAELWELESARAYGFQTYVLKQGLTSSAEPQSYQTWSQEREDIQNVYILISIGNTLVCQDYYVTSERPYVDEEFHYENPDYFL